jgi:hypothetical protein
MNDLWKQLPNDILNQVIKYDNKIKNRNGMYINQISKDEERYKILLGIPKKKIEIQTYGWNRSYKVIVNFKTQPYSCLIITILDDGIVEEIYKDFVYEKNVFSTEYNIEYVNKYIYGQTHKYMYNRKNIVYKID